MDRRKCYRRPKPGLCATTAVVLTYMGFCVLLCILAATGHLLNNQSFECGRREEDASRLEDEASLVYLTAGMNAALICLVLMMLWIKYCEFLLSIAMLLQLGFFVFIILNFVQTWEKENEEIQAFEERYSALIPLNNVSEKTQKYTKYGTCTIFSNVHRWQAEYKCCGLEGYEDWGSAIPDSCLCGEKNDSSGCVEAGNSLVYMKPCFPTVLSLVAKRSSTFWIVMIIWITLNCVPVTLCLAGFIFMAYICCSDCYTLSVWKYKLSGGEKLVPVVFIRKDNNNEETEKDEEEERAKDGQGEEVPSNGVVVEAEEGTTVREEMLEVQRPNAVTVIPVSLLQRLQEELEPPPVQHQAQCLCLFPSKPKKVYTVYIEDSSPLLPSDAVLADAKKPMDCFYVEGPHFFELEHIVWPKESESQFIHSP